MPSLRFTLNGEPAEVDIVLQGLSADEPRAFAENQRDNLAVIRAVVGGAGLGSGHASGGTITMVALYISDAPHQNR